jgi:glycine/D-amino acid oxidase-like deaminating enzyme
MHTDILIIGQGIAGTCLAFELLDRGFSIHIMDDAHATAASQVEIAVINPVTGRRYAKSWEIDSLIPLADATYTHIEALLQAKYLSAVNLIQILPDDRTEEIWMMRSADPEFQEYLDPEITTLHLPGVHEVSAGRILNGRHLRISALLSDARRWFLDQGLLTTTEFQPAHLELTDSGLSYGDGSYHHIVFCQGNRVLSNPYFKFLEVYPMKGEYLICKIPGLELKEHIKSNISLIPLDQPDHYWCGSTYDRYNQDPKPTTTGRDYLLKQLSKILKMDVEVIQQGVGIRATTRDRRPYVGAHPDHTRVHVITGLGTKGISLAPYCAEVLADSLETSAEIPDEVDILRHTRR